MSLPDFSAGAGVRGQDDPLFAGEKVKVHVNVFGTRSFTHVAFYLMCAYDGSRSTSIYIWKMSPTDKKIRWNAFWNGNEAPSYPNLPSRDSSEPYPEDQEFPGGPHTFVVERCPAAAGVDEHLALWLEERPDVVAKVRIQEGCDRLRTTTFIGSVSPKFYNSEGLCGHQGMALRVGSKVRVGVHALRTENCCTLVLRRPEDAAEASRSSSVRVTGIAKDRRNWGYSATGPDGQLTKNMHLPQRRDPCGMPLLSDHLPEGEHVFVVERRPAEMAVWLESRPDFVATTPAREDETLLLEMLAPLNRVLYDKHPENRFLQFSF